MSSRRLSSFDRTQGLIGVVVALMLAALIAVVGVLPQTRTASSLTPGSIRVEPLELPTASQDFNDAVMRAQEILGNPDLQAEWDLTPEEVSQLASALELLEQRSLKGAEGTEYGFVGKCVAILMTTLMILQGPGEPAHTPDPQPAAAADYFAAEGRGCAP